MRKGQKWSWLLLSMATLMQVTLVCDGEGVADVFRAIDGPIIIVDEGRDDDCFLWWCDDDDFGDSFDFDFDFDFD